jgi:predicted dehydrogenase
LLPTDDVRWAVLGTSEFALDWVVPGLRSARGARLVAVVSRDPAALGSRWQPPDGVAVVPDLDAAADLGVEAVHLVAPNGAHAELTLRACALGMHPLVEKPITVTVDECLKLERAAQDAGVLLTVGSCMAWAPPVVAAADAVRAGLVGPATYAAIAVGFDAPPPGGWRQTTPTEAGGGPLYDLGAHAVDALLRILGPATEVAALLDHRRHEYVAHDSASLLLRFASGAHAQAHLSFAAPFNTFSVYGPEGRLESSQWLGLRFRGNLSHVVDGPGAIRFAETPDLATTAFPLETTQVVLAQAQEVSAAIRGGPAPRNAVRPHALAVVEVLEAAVRSATTGKSVRFGTAK